jgi:hypothetical protein
MPTRSTPHAALAFSGGLVAACISALLTPAGALAQQCEGVCTDPAKACVCIVAPPNARFNLTRVGERPQDGKVGLALNPGDQVASTDSDAIVELACPGGSEVKLHGLFHALVLVSAEGQDCAFNLLDGNADVLARKPTSLDAGEALMGSISTQYGMRVDRAGRWPRFECVVFEGLAQVRYRGDETFDLAESGQATLSDNGGVEKRSITPETVAAASQVYARADVARLAARGAPPTDSAALVAQLTSAYATVFARPRDVDARLQMASLQTNLGNARQVLYQVDQAERIDPARTQLNADVAVLKYNAYTKLGQQENANEQAQRIKRLDPQRYNRLPEAVIRDSQRINEPLGRAQPQEGVEETRPVNRAAIRVQP